jgi:hypothetical protein
MNHPICSECETVAHCTEHGCIPKQQALDKMAENARELGLDYEPAAKQSLTVDHTEQHLEMVAQPAQQESESNKAAYQRGYLDGMAKPCIECADRQWVGLTHDEYDAICDKHSAMSDFDFLADIEAKLRSKNENHY